MKIDPYLHAALLLQGAGKEISKEGKIEPITLVEVQPKTGRTHQIRVHFAAIQHPVVGDRVYAPKKPTVLGFERLALHSRSIEFDNVEGKRVKVLAPLPRDFKEACKELNVAIPV